MDVSGRYELSSEAKYENARERTFPLREDNPTFCDQIVTVDYNPGDDVEYTVIRRDGKFVDRVGAVCQ